MKIHTPGLAGWLAIVTTLLVTLAVTAVSVAGVRLLRDLAEAEALTRVELGVSSALEALRQGAEDVQTAAAVLGERPTLLRLLRSSSMDGLDPYLVRYCEGAILDGCAVVRDGTLIASTGSRLDWPAILEDAEEQGQQFLVTGAAQGAALVGAKAEVASLEDVNVMAVREMDGPFAARLSERVGLEIRVLDFASFQAGDGDFAVLNSDALAVSAPVSDRIRSLGLFAASLPVSASSGETVALLQAVLPEAEVMRPVAKLERRMLLIAGVVALLATLAGIMLGHHWIDGVKRLTLAARRIGAGDLGASIPGEGGKELGILSTTMEEMRRSLVDLTDEIRRREADAQAVLSGIVEGVYAVDRERKIRFLNPQAEKLLKVSASDALGQFCGDVLKPERDSRGRRPCEYACPIMKARNAGSAEAREQIKPVTGRVRRVVITSAAANDGMQVQVMRDETDLEAVRRTRDTVLANISHEFRTPLAAQLASIELLRDGIGSMTPPAQRELVSSLERGVQRLTWLIDNLLESVRIESGQLSIRRHDVRLDAVVEAARDLINPLIEQRGQVLDVTLPEGHPVIRGDQQRLTQVFVNLLANASKFAPPGSVIRVGGRITPNGIAFWVEDEGPGPRDPEDATLFEQFRRSGGEDPEESGLGLGLFIVRSIVERHGGHVSLSRTPDSRTRAQVELPRELPTEFSRESARNAPA
ncbi:MAG TPA: ATP-binding protein [Woeseiaceae bacterium]|nr:ATP-binding protein [Woeseiaceae bacterium]